ncbi:hypothetical protein [Streptosporangium sp. NPDC002524]|uniref:hypothetical protein n=1 Tax=Streptosporangium sp. NPDC002524 TaxID=3154537 RepID=UPI0033276C22
MIDFAEVNVGDELRFITPDKGGPSSRTGIVTDKSRITLTVQITSGSVSRGTNLTARLMARTWDTRAVTLVRRAGTAAPETGKPTEQPAPAPVAAEPPQEEAEPAEVAIDVTFEVTEETDHTVTMTVYVPENIADDPAAVEDYITEFPETWLDEFDPLECVTVNERSIGNLKITSNYRTPAPAPAEADQVLAPPF